MMQDGTTPIANAAATLPAELTERDALAMFGALAERFGWAYCLWNRGVADMALWTMQDGETPLTDDEWARVVTTSPWKVDLSEVGYDMAWTNDILTSAVRAAGVVCGSPKGCATRLTAPPEVTGRLCDACRIGPDGCALFVHPVTAGLFCLDQDGQLLYSAPGECGEPDPAGGALFCWASSSPDESMIAERAQHSLKSRQ